MGQRRIGCDRLHSKVMSAESAALLITSGITVGMSGFTDSGYPSSACHIIPIRSSARRRSIAARTMIKSAALSASDCATGHQLR
jgi:acyl-CoA hydrolase